jgi:hypothetical protein
MRHHWLISIPLTLVCGSALPQVMPPNAESEYFRTFGSGVLLRSSVTPTEIIYTITLDVRRPLPDKAVIVVQFENPNPKANPIDVVVEPKPDEKKILIHSPSLACIINNKGSSDFPVGNMSRV